MYQVYVLRSVKTGRYYFGSCEDLEERLKRHNAGQSISTKHGCPWEVVYEEFFHTRSLAMKRERQMKNWRSRVAIERLIAKR